MTLMPLWKRLVLISASAGAGVAVTLLLIIGGHNWYQSRPKPWDTSAVKATFHYIDTEGVNTTLVFMYTLENTTDFDYRLPDKSRAVVMAKLKKEKSLSDDSGYIKVDYPVFVPAKQRLRFFIHIPYSYTEPLDFYSVIRDPNFLGLPLKEKHKVLLSIGQDFARLPKIEQDRILYCIQAGRDYPEKLEACATREQWETYRKKLAAYVNKQMPNLDGFVLFDNINRYQIDFPKGW